MNDPNLIVCRDAADLSRRAAEELIRLAGEAHQSAGRCTVALSGGSTPKALYSLLASPQYSARVDWSKTHLFWGDERCVPPAHPASNYRMVEETLLSKVPIPRENVHPMAGDKAPQVAAAEYEAGLKRFFQLDHNELPRFDLILLGLGDDGHTASLFPKSKALAEDQHLVAAAYVKKLKAHRLTLTLPVLNHAAQILFLVAGSSKSNILEQLFCADLESQKKYPAARVNPIKGAIRWMVDDAAARAVQNATSFEPHKRTS